MCAGCVQSNSDRRCNQGPSFRPPQAPHPHAGQEKTEQRKGSMPDGGPQVQRPGLKARPLHEDLGEFLERCDASRAVPQSPVSSSAISVCFSEPVRVAASESSRSAPVREVASDRGQRDASGSTLQRHDRAPTPDLDEDLDNLDILLAIGFGQEQATTALQRCSSIVEAVEYIMKNRNKGASGEYATPTAQTVYAAAQPAAKVIYGFAVGAYGAEAQRFQFKRVALALLNLGYSVKQACEAAKRCSSVEAALDWIDMHPEV